MVKKNYVKGKFVFEDELIAKGLVVNESGSGDSESDFRAETISNSDAFHVDASADQINAAVPLVSTSTLAASNLSGTNTGDQDLSGKQDYLGEVGTLCTVGDNNLLTLTQQPHTVEESSTITSFNQPHGNAVTNTGKVVYSSNAGDGIVVLNDPLNDITDQSLYAIGGPNIAALGHDKSTDLLYYVKDVTPNYEIYSFNAETGVSTLIATSGTPYTINANSTWGVSNSKLYIGHSSGIIDIWQLDGTFVKTLSTGGSAYYHAFATDPDEDYVYMSANGATDKVVKIDTTTDLVVDTYSTSGVLWTDDMVYLNGYLYLGAELGPQLQKVDTSDMTLVKSILVGSTTYCVTTDGEKVYSPPRDAGGKMLVYDPRSDTYTTYDSDYYNEMDYVADGKWITTKYDSDPAPLARIEFTNLVGTTNGDTTYWRNDGTSTATGNWDIGSNTFTAANVTGTNTGDQDLSPYFKKDGSELATGNWDLDTYDVETTGSFKTSTPNSATLVHSGTAYDIIDSAPHRYFDDNVPFVGGPVPAGDASAYEIRFTSGPMNGQTYYPTTFTSGGSWNGYDLIDFGVGTLPSDPSGSTYQIWLSASGTTPKLDIHDDVIESTTGQVDFSDDNIKTTGSITANDFTGDGSGLTNVAYRAVQIVANTQAEGNLNLSDGTNWNVDTSNISTITSVSSSTDYKLELYPDDTFTGTPVLLGDHLNGTEVINVNYNYTDDDATKEVHIKYTDNAGTDTVDLDIRGTELR